MKILYITTHFLSNSSASIRNISLVNGLIENGCEVEILTVQVKEDEYLKEKLSSKVKIKKKIPIDFYNKITSKEIKKYTQIKILKNIKEKLKSWIIFPDVYNIAIKKITKEKIIQGEYNYIISSSDSKSSHFMALELIKKNNLNIDWIQIWGDPWYSDINVEKSIFFKKRIRKNEEKLLGLAKKVFYISALTSKNIKETYPLYEKKIESLGRSFLEKIEHAPLEKNEIVFVYTGTLKKRNINYLVQKIKSYNKNNYKKIKLKIYGDFFEESEYITSKERVSYKEVIEAYKEADVLIYIDNQGQTTQIPGKIYDYFGTNKTILGLYERKDTYNFLKDFKRIELMKNEEKFIELEKLLQNIKVREVLDEFSPKMVAANFVEKIRN
jgi:hypothetical protein